MEEIKVSQGQVTRDSYTNLAANLGLGASNLSETGGYVMTRFTWDYMTLNTLYRNNWIAKYIIDKPANEMLKNGFEIQSQIDPARINDIHRVYRKTRTGAKLLEALKWSRLYGGAVLVPLIEGQEDLSAPLDLDTIMPDAYKGCYVVDRWSGVSPSSEIVTDIGSVDYGKPEYYLVTDDATGASVRVHHSRIVKLVGRTLPKWEEIAENYWGASELEHIFTELRKRDSTSANIAFLIFLANIRVYKMQDLGQLLSVGDQEAANRVFQTMQRLNAMMCNTGTLAVDATDDFDMKQYSFGGINDIYESFMLDISGAAEIPCDKLFGRSPAGFNSGDMVLQSYYDNIQEKQEAYVRDPLEKLINIISMSALGKIPDDLEIVFNPVRHPNDGERAELAQRMAQPVFDAFDRGIIGKATALKELRTQTPIVSVWSNITDEMIESAEDEDETREKEEKETEALLKDWPDKNEV